MDSNDLALATRPNDLDDLDDLDDTVELITLELLDDRRPPRRSPRPSARPPAEWHTRWYHKRSVWVSVLSLLAAAWIAASLLAGPGPAPTPPPTPASTSTSTSTSSSPVPATAEQIVAGETNTDLVQQANNLSIGFGHTPTADKSAYEQEILTRFSDDELPASHVLCVNDSSLWGAPDHPKTIWRELVGPQLNLWLFYNGMQYPPPGTWNDPIPPEACS
jgi:hypothetical protein